MRQRVTIVYRDTGSRDGLHEVDSVTVRDGCLFMTEVGSGSPGTRDQRIIIPLDLIRWIGVNDGRK